MSDEQAAKHTLLVADDQRDVREALRMLLADQGYQVVLADSPQAVVGAVKNERVSLALLDLNYTRDTTSGKEGIELLKSLQDLDADLPTVAMTAWGSVDLAVSALQNGACDFVEKTLGQHPFADRGAYAPGTQYGHARGPGACVRSPISSAKTESAETSSRSRRACSGVVELARRVAPSDASVLLTGENGTGKNLVAELIHRWSNRADEPFISVNMGSIPESLFESEMFGHEKGAFTDAREARSGRFELADNGTLFLDEVGNTPQTQQAKLLRVLESGCFERVGGSRTLNADVRMLTATNADLEAMIEQGSFRKDLLFRLNTVEINIPPLRERGHDILLLAERFLADQQRRRSSSLKFSDEAVAALRTHHWPGNVRELAHAVERAVLLCHGGVIEPADLALAGHGSGSAGTRAVDGQIMKLAEAEKLLIQNALERFDGNVQDAADALGLSRSAMYRRLEKLGISLEVE